MGDGLPGSPNSRESWPTAQLRAGAEAAVEALALRVIADRIEADKSDRRQLTLFQREASDVPLGLTEAV